MSWQGMEETDSLLAVGQWQIFRVLVTPDARSCVWPRLAAGALGREFKVETRDSQTQPSSGRCADWSGLVLRHVMSDLCRNRYGIH